jgi:hypothetical protein
MPSTSKKQHNLMAMVATNPAKAKELGIPQSVGSEFMHADKGKKFGKGGEETRPDRQAVNQPKTQHGKSALFAKGGHVMATKKMSKGGDTTMSNPMREKRGMTMEKMSKVKAGGHRPHGEHSIQEKGHTKARMPKMAGSTTGMKKGGKVKR